MGFNAVFTRFASGVARATGSPAAFVICVAVVVAWALSGPLFHFSDTWQLVINTGTTIVTFLMVFLIQNTQNRDGAAIQIKLDELILTSKAENEFIGIEKLTDEELDLLRSRCAREAERSRRMLEKTDEVLSARRGPGKTPPSPETSRKAAPRKAAPRKRAARPRSRDQA